MPCLNTSKNVNVFENCFVEKVLIEEVESAIRFIRSAV